VRDRTKECEEMKFKKVEGTSREERPLILTPKRQTKKTTQ
jgi:hypothetical protein